MIFIWNLTFDESATTFQRRAIAQKMAITIAFDLILADLSVTCRGLHKTMQAFDFCAGSPVNSPAAQRAE